MKRCVIFFTFILEVIFLLTLCGCKTVYPLSQANDKIIKIEVIEVKDYRFISHGEFDKVTTLAIIEPAEYDAFISEFYDVHCEESLGPSQECIEGKAIRFTYSNGAFEIVSAESGFYCSENNEWSYPAFYFDYSEFYNFVSSWEK